MEGAKGRRKRAQLDDDQKLSSWIAFASDHNFFIVFLHSNRSARLDTSTRYVTNASLIENECNSSAPRFGE